MTITGLLNVLAVNPRPPIAHRARVHVAARRPRVQVSRAEQEAVVERFLAAVRNGDLQGLLDVLAPDVVVVSDGGGLVAAARRPIEGANRVAPVLGSLAGLAGDFEVMPIWLKGGLAVRLDLNGELNAVASLVIEDAQITRIYTVLNRAPAGKPDLPRPPHPCPLAQPCSRGRVRLSKPGC